VPPPLLALALPLAFGADEGPPDIGVLFSKRIKHHRYIEVNTGLCVATLVKSSQHLRNWSFFLQMRWRWWHIYLCLLCNWRLQGRRFIFGEAAVAMALPMEPFLAKVSVKAFLVQVVAVHAKLFLAEV